MNSNSPLWSFEELSLKSPPLKTFRSDLQVVVGKIRKPPITACFQTSGKLSQHSMFQTSVSQVQAFTFKQNENTRNVPSKFQYRATAKLYL